MASIRKRTTRHGVRYGVRYRTLEGDQREETFRTRREADHRLHAIEADKLRGGWLDPRRAARPFGEICEEWLASNPAKRDSTVARDRSTLDVHILPTLGRTPVGSVTPRAIQMLVKGWTTAPVTTRRNFGMLRAVLNYAVECDVIARSPARGVKLPTVEQKKHRIIDADELATLAEALGPEHAPMAYLGALLGFRWGEVAALRVGRVDFWPG
jgi:integrase